MVTSPGAEPTLADVASNLATVSAEVGQQVVLMSTANLSSPPDGPDPEDSSELPQSSPLWWRNWPSPQNGDVRSTDAERARLHSGPVSPGDVEDLLGDTGVPGVSRLDLRYFVGHPAQVVIRVPELLTALLQIVDVVILEVPSYLSVHHGEALTPLVDVVLVVSEFMTTTVEQVRKTSAALKRLGAPVVGMALTRAQEPEYEWGLAAVDEQTDEQDDPTEQILISESTGVHDAAPLDHGFVVEHAPREA
jgi:hypothetical protein